MERSVTQCGELCRGKVPRWYIGFLDAIFDRFQGEDYNADRIKGTFLRPLEATRSELLVELLYARSKNYSTAGDGILLPCCGADVARNNFACVNADADPCWYKFTVRRRQFQHF